MKHGVGLGVEGVGRKVLQTPQAPRRMLLCVITYSVKKSYLVLLAAVPERLRGLTRNILFLAWFAFEHWATVTQHIVINYREMHRFESCPPRIFFLHACVGPGRRAGGGKAVWARARGGEAVQQEGVEVQADERARGLPLLFF